MPVFNAFDDPTPLDRLVHEPARLIILTALASCRCCDFRFMQSVTHLSKGNLSNHLQKLEEGQLVEIIKGYRGRVPRTTLRISAKGRSAIERHWKQLERLRNTARNCRPD